jgi:hypothetical protein
MLLMAPAKPSAWGGLVAGPSPDTVAATPVLSVGIMWLAALVPTRAVAAVAAAIVIVGAAAGARI